MIEMEKAALECDGMDEYEVDWWALCMWMAAIQDRLRKEFFMDFFETI